MSFSRTNGCVMGRLKENDLRRIDSQRIQTVLGDLTCESIDIFCWCNRCGHNAVVATAVLIARFDPTVPVPEVGARLRCSGCGSKDIATRPDWPSLGQVARHG
jgi:hypothetical protein